MSNSRLKGAAGRHTRFATPVACVLAALVVVACGKSNEVDLERTASLIQPVARLELKMVKEEPGKRTGEQIYKNVCTSCHAAGVLGAPATGDAAAWAPRLAQGFEALVASVTNGKNAMPAKGGGTDLTDTEIQRAVAYLTNTAGGNFTEPPVE
ncbi:MAG: cytochrome c5 family protein [Zoogloeaceae bacterium]|nr:cytochrome c5 family protein [Zoogloeaceae bacterium]